MALQEINREDIPEVTRGESKVRAVIAEFLDSGMDAAKVDGDYGKGFGSAVNAHARKNGLEVRAVRRSGDLFLIAEAPAEATQDAGGSE